MKAHLSSILDTSDNEAIGPVSEGDSDFEQRVNKGVFPRVWENDFAKRHIYQFNQVRTDDVS